MVDFKPPKFKHIKSYLEKYNNALEITIVTEGQIPPRAATPVLYMADAKISYYTIGKKENEYLFYAFEWKKMKEGEVIQWGWDNDPTKRIQKTKFHLQIPQQKN